MDFNTIITTYSLIGIFLLIIKNIYLYKFFNINKKNKIELEKLILNINNIFIIIYIIFGIYMLFLEVDYIFSILVINSIIFSFIFSIDMKNYKAKKILFFISLLEIILGIYIFFIYNIQAYE